MINKKQLYIIIIVVIIIGVFVAIKFWPKGYSDNPKDWIENGKIDVQKATKDLSYQDFIGQQYKGDIKTVFQHDGSYLGNYFEDEYVLDNKVMIRFTENIKPNNNIPEIFIFEVIENNEPIVHIFLDEDWKNSLDYTNIVWGKDYQSEKSFNYKEIENGIYYDSVKDDKSRFSEDYKIHYSGIIVGQVNQEDILENNLQNTIIVRLK